MADWKAWKSDSLSSAQIVSCAVACSLVTEILGEGDSPKLELVCRDAESFMAQNERKYDLVFVDVFKGREVPGFVTTQPFLMQCRDSLSPGGRLALNYIEVDKQRWEDVQELVAIVFPGCQTVSNDDNRILISSAF